MLTDEQMADIITQQMNQAAVGGRGDGEKPPDNNKAPAKHGDANDDPGAGKILCISHICGCQ